MRSHAEAVSAGPVPTMRLLACVVAVVGLLGATFGAGQARALDRYVDGGDIPGMALSFPTKMAVDQATGNLLIVDRGLHEVQVWGPGGSASTQVLTFAQGFSFPYGIAIDQSNGDAYVSNSARNEEQRITVAGAGGGTFTLTFNGQTTAPIAFDASPAAVQSALVALSNIGPGDVQVEENYVVTFAGAFAKTDVSQLSADGSGLADAPPDTASVTTATPQPGGPDEIVRFQPDDRDNPTTYTRDLSYVSPTQGSDATAGQIGSFASPLAVDPATGDLLVADTGNKYVIRFDSSGGFVNAFNGSDTAGGAFLNLFDIVVGGGVTYVLDATDVYDSSGPAMLGSSRVEMFDGADGSLGTLPNIDHRLDKARDLGYGVTSGSVLIAEQRGSTPPGRMHVYRNGQPYQDMDFATGCCFGQTGIVGVAVDEGRSGESGRIYGLRSPGWFDVVGTPGIQLFTRLQLPDVTLDPPSGIGAQSVHLQGTVDPVGRTVNAPANFHFEYCVAAPACSTNGPLDPNAPDPNSPWKLMLDQSSDAGSSSGVASPEADATGLTPHTTYQVRLVANNDDGQNVSAIQMFTTLDTAPAVGSESVTERGPSSATLRAAVTPFGLPTSFHFEYGTTTAYGTRAPALNERTAGDGQAPYAVAQVIGGLQPETTYHYRVVAHSAAGDTLGDDRTFTTTAVPSSADARAYELVSPVEKNGNNVKSQLGMQASADGNVFGYVAATELGSGEAAPLYPRYVAHRTATGWVNRATDPPQGAVSTPIKLTVGVSDDGTKAVVISEKALAPGATEDGGNVYLRDVATGAYTTMATTPDSLWLRSETYVFSTVFVQGTANFDHVLLLGQGTTFLPGAPDGALYEYTDGQLSIVSRNVANTPIPGSGIGNGDHGRNVLSADGSRLVFGSTDAVYYRSDGVTRVLSASRRSSDPGTLQTGTLVGGDRDLKLIYFLSHDLTDDSVPGEISLYRYEPDSDQLALLTTVTEGPANGFTYFQVSDNGDSVYFSSTAALTSDAVADSQPNIYAWHDGSLALIAKVDTNYDRGGVGGLARYWASSNGRYFAFYAATKITDYETLNPACNNTSIGEGGKCQEAYRYDTVANELICVSCRPDGHLPTASAYLGDIFAEVGSHAFLRSVNNDGHVFFGSTEQLVERDTNGTWDVYEYDGEQLQLLSTGTGGPALLGDVSEDGRDVFFTTQDRLVAIDTDDAFDVYDARVGGGIAGQNERPPSTGCADEGCRGAAGAAPPPPPSASEVGNGPRNFAGRKKQRCGKGRHKVVKKGKSRCVKRNRANQNRRQGR